jgi:phage terminase large subunit-like protein
LPTVDIDRIKEKLAECYINFVAKRDLPGADGQPQSAVYFSCVTITNNSFLIELKFKGDMNLCKVTVKSTNKGLSELCKVTVAKVLMAP